MTVIATEISYSEPLEIDSLFSMAGERFDFVLNADQKAKDYWIRVKTMYPCRDIVESFAILRYGEDHRIAGEQRIAFSSQLPPKQSDKFPQKKLFNSPTPKVKDIPLIKMKAYDVDESIIFNPPDHKHFLFIDSPTVLDDTLEKNGNYYRLSCE
jgi:hypothetical protein